MRVRHGLLTLTTLIGLITLFGISAMAADLYQYEDDRRFWWYLDTDPAFEMLVPSNPSGSKYPLYIHREQFGEEVLEILLGENGPLMTVGVLKGSQSQVTAIRNNLVGSRKHLFSNVRVTADREITTSMGLKATFYAQVARGADGKDALFRSVFFNRGNDLVYLTYFLNNADYTGFNEEAWIRAVNTFRWN